MRGSKKILMAIIALVLLAAPIAMEGGELRSLPTDKTIGTLYSLVRFDSVIYRVNTEVPCELTFVRIDDAHHRLYVATIPDGVTACCNVAVQWGDFPPVILGVELGGSNSWLLGIETGYAEK